MENSKVIHARSFYTNDLGEKSFHKTDAHAHFWASEFEYSVYWELRRAFPKEWIKHQQPCKIIPKDSLFPQKNWVIDFLVQPPSSYSKDFRLLIEAKGSWIWHNKSEKRNLQQNIHLLHIFNPLDYNVLYLVGTETKTILKPVKVWEYKEKIQELKEMYA